MNIDRKELEEMRKRVRNALKGHPESIIKGQFHQETRNPIVGGEEIIVPLIGHTEAHRGPRLLMVKAVKDELSNYPHARREGKVWSDGLLHEFRQRPDGDFDYVIMPTKRIPATDGIDPETGFHYRINRGGTHRIATIPSELSLQKARMEARRQTHEQKQQPENQRPRQQPGRRG